MRRLVLIACLAAAVLTLTAGPVAARTGRCLGGGGGPVCHVWTGKVTSVKDGDTIGVDIARDGKRRDVTVRLTAVQAMEQSVYSFRHPERRRGECHALEATARLEQLIRASRFRVRLTAQYPSSRASKHRLKRSVAVRIGGRWRDAGEILLAEGHAIWLAGTVEDAWHERYNRAEQEAALKGIGLWNPTHCGAGPSQHVPLRLWVSWDPLSSDVEHLNGEWIKVQNRSATEAISLARWWARDSDLRRFTFPAGTTLAPGETATLYAGAGQPSGNDFFWHLAENPFQNPGNSHHLGDGGFLFDPQGDLRASMVYPCAVACTSPDQGAVRVTAQPRRTEYAEFRNVSDRAVDLYGYAMTIQGSSYPFGPRSVLEPGEAVRVYVAGDPSQDTATERYWGVDGRLLPDEGGWVRLSTFTGITLGCDSWGSGSC